MPSSSSWARSAPGSRTDGTWQLREQDANIARYEAWRGGVRSDGKTGASVAMEVLRRKAQIGAGIAIAGIVIVAIGFVVR